ncbi:DNA-directed RNA polymerase subunit D [Candidatus Pacearchaeota archaeon]|nr:DNA-directed RNA polymerase subunit D [Candidatus Pacearchaeota archaeon]
MEIINQKDNKLIFKAKIDESLANAIRRYVGEIPVLAVEEVEISKNDSPLYDETISHRIGLIPIKTDKEINEKTEAKLKLSVKREGEVYSGELKGDVEGVYDKIPITILTKNQELELTANVRAGKGDEHARFSPGLIFYRGVAEIIMDKEFRGEIQKVCLDNEIKEKGDKIIVIDDKEKEVCDVCEGICERAKKKAETNYNDELIINIESFGQLDVKDIFKKSIGALRKDLNEVSKKIK